SNIMISRHGQVKLTDFGIARWVGRRNLTTTGTVRGKLAYLSPEQALGRQVDQRSDVFALGLTLFELLSGARATKDASMPELLEFASKPVFPRLPPPVPAALADLVATMLAADPDRRPQDAAQVRAALDGYLAQLPRGRE